MIDWRRILLGLTVLMLLIPVVAVGSPESVPGFLRFWMEDTEGRLDDLEERLATLEAAATSSTVTTIESSSEPPNATSTTEATTSTSHHHETPTTSSTTSTSLSSTTTTHEHTTTTTSDSTTTTGHSTTTHTTIHASGDTITGDACPCMVTGTTTLVGTINLKGDIMVDGGTLIARPGVSLNGNGYQIMFMNGGKADFQGTKVFTWSGNGSNQNLERDINFRDLRRIMFHHHAGKSILRYFAVADSGTTGVLGDYPIHFHLNGNSVLGTLVEGVVVLNGKNHAFVPHGSHGITFRDTIAKNTIDHAYWWDPPGTNRVNCDADDFKKFCTDDNSNNIVYEHALADGVTPPPGEKGYRLTAFMLGAGSGNIVVNSTAINVGGRVDCSGFQWPEAAGQNVGGSVWVFRNNHGMSSCHGIFVWQNDGGQVHVIDGFTGGGIKHGAYKNLYQYDQVNVPYVVQAAVGSSLSYSNSYLGDAVMSAGLCSNSVDCRVTFTDVTFGSFTVDDGDKPHGVSYLLNGTNVSCVNVIYKNPHPDSTVIINGVSC